jgi:hypothetical protein
LACHLQIDADPDPVPDPAYHFDGNPDAEPDPDFFYADADPHYQNDADQFPQHCQKLFLN